MKRILILLAACLLLIGAIVGTVAANTPTHAAAQYSDLDYRVSNGKYNDPVFMGDVLDMLLDEDVTQQEKDALRYDFGGSYALYTTSPMMMDLDVTYDGKTQTLTIIVGDYYDEARNGNPFLWIPFKAKVGDLVADFEQTDFSEFHYCAVIEGLEWTDEAVSLSLEYQADFEISDDTLNDFINFAYEKSLELDDLYAAYELKLSKYEADLNAYNENQLEWDLYNTEMVKYENHLAELALYADYLLYQDYLAREAQYQIDLSAYKANQAEWATYNTQLNKYYSYLSYNAIYPGELAKYNEKMNTVNHQLALLRYMEQPDPVTGVSFVDLMIDDDITKAIVDKRDDLVKLKLVSEAVIDNAEAAANYLQTFCKTYKQKTTDREKYIYYMQEYTRLVQNLHKLYNNMKQIYDHKLLYTVLQSTYPEHIYRMPRMLAQLYVYGAVFDDTETMVISTKVDKHNNKTAAQLMDASCRPSTDSNNAKPLTAWPEKPIDPAVYEVKVEPTKPSVTLTAPTKPDMPTFSVVKDYSELPSTMKDPGYMEKPTPPAQELEHPGTRPELAWSDSLFELYEAYKAGKIVQREPFQKAQTLTMTAALHHSFTMSEDEHYCSVKFYNTDEQNSYLGSSVVFYGESAAYPSELALPTKPSSAEFDYEFAGWVDANGEAVDLSVVSESMNVYASYREIRRHYTVTWVVQDQSFTEDVEYGQLPVFEGSTDRAPDSQYHYTFTGWGTEVVPVTGNVTYTAQYEKTVREYKVTFVAEGQTYYSATYLYGQTMHDIAELKIPPTKQNTAQYTYTFKGWKDAEGNVYTLEQIPTLTANTTYTAVFDATVNQYTVTWIVEGEQYTHSYPYGEIPSFGAENPTKAATAQYEYAFAGWDHEIIAVHGDATYTAQFTAKIRSYTIKFTVEGQTQSYVFNYGETPSYEGTPSKASTVKYAYTFIGWDHDIESVTGDAEYVAEFEATVRKYPVKFVVDGQEQTFEFDYDTMPVYPNGTPTKAPNAEYAYVFTGWDRELELVSDQLVTYTAQFATTTNTYTVTWIVEGVQTTQTYQYGQTPSFGAENPTKAATAQYTYTFAGWDKEIEAVKGDATYIAQFTPTLRTYTITWIVEGEQTTQTYQYGQTPSFGAENPTKSATAQYEYTFSGWDHEIAEVLGDATYTAQFTTKIRSYTIKFTVDGQTQSYVFNYGETPFYEGTPSKASTVKYAYTFIGWDHDIGSVTGDAEYVAEFEATVRKYPVKFVIDGQEYTFEFEYDAVPEYPNGTPTKADDAQYAYTFTGWTPVLAPVTEQGATYTAVFEETAKQYTVTWIVEGVQTTQTYQYGQTPSFGGTPTKAPTIQYEYIFLDWGKEIEDVTGDAQYVARFTESVRKYPVRFVVEGNEYTFEFEYGSMPKYPNAIPTKPDDEHHRYIFTGWDREFEAVTDQLVTYTAQFEAIGNKYIITWIVGEEQFNQAYDYGSMPSFGKTPTRTATAQYEYTFTGWDKEIIEVQGDATYTAQFTETLRSYTITFTVEGQVQSYVLNYGEIPSYEETPSKASTVKYAYAFIGWDKEIEPVTGDAQYVAEFEATVRKYPVKFVIDGQEYTFEFEYDAMPAYPNGTPTKAGDAQHAYVFTGWDREFEAVTDQLVTYTAQFEETTNVYTVTWIVDGKVTTQTFAYGQTPSCGEIPTKTATAQYTYTFKGWKNAQGYEYTADQLPALTENVTYTAVFDETLNRYTITWIVDGEQTTQTYEYGQMPTFGKTPTKAETAQYEYVFNGWDYELTTVRNDATYTAQFTTKTRSYTITFIVDGKSESFVFNYGVMPYYEGIPGKASTVKYAYTFTNWDTSLQTVTGDAQYVAEFEATVRKYPVKFVIDGQEYTFEFEYDAMPAYPNGTPTKAGDAQHVYVFTGWDREFEAVTDQLVTYTAQFEESTNVYTVTWIVDGKVTTQTFAYGQTPSYGEIPTKTATAQYTYTFAGWDKELEAVEGDVTYTARFTSTLRSYTITWIVEGEQTIQTYTYGQVPSFGAVNPTKAATARYEYTFTNWDKDVTEVRKDETYTALFTAKIRRYTVTFTVDGQTQSIEFNYGEMPQYQGIPSKAATVSHTYTFLGWDKDIETVTKDTEYVARFKETLRKYAVKFVIDGREQTVEFDYGTMPVYPYSTPTKAGDAQHKYVFTGWDRAFELVTEHPVTYTAVFEATTNMYTVTWSVDGKVTTQTYQYGQMPSFGETNPSKNATAQYTYRFTGWNKEIEAVKGDVTYIAQFSETLRSYTITWIVDGETSAQTYQYGQIPSYGANPAKAATAQFEYLFSGWDHEIAEVRSDMTYIARFTSRLRSYTVKFTVDGQTQSVVLNYGAMPHYDGIPRKADTVKYSYTFLGWDKDVETVISDVEYVARFQETVRKYPVKFVIDGHAYTFEFEYDTMPEYPNGTPVKAGDAQYSFTFTGWSPVLAPVTDQLVTYTAGFEQTTNTYTVTWIVDGVQTTQTYQYGQTPSYGETNPGKNATAQYTYTFTGWDKEITDVCENATYVARFTEELRSYTVTFTVNGQTQSVVLEYGALPSYEGTPGKDSTVKYKYTFLGWDKDFEKVTGDANYVACFEESVRQYPVKFVVDGQEYIFEFAYDSVPAYPGETPIKAADAQYTYTFTGWSPAFKPVSDQLVTYTAEFSNTTILYTITWIVDDNQTTQTYEYGQMPSFGAENPSKDATVQHEYKFIDWDKTVEPVTGDAQYVARFEEINRKYPVKFVVDGQEYTFDFEYGSIPAYPNGTPTKADDAQFTYTFTGWDRAFESVTEQVVTYTAVFEATPLAPETSEPETSEPETEPEPPKDFDVTIQNGVCDIEMSGSGMDMTQIWEMLEEEDVSGLQISLNDGAMLIFPKEQVDAFISMGDAVSAIRLAGVAYDGHKAYEIALLDSQGESADALVAALTIRLPHRNASGADVYRVKEDGTLEKVDAKQVGGYLEFSVMDLSTFVIKDKYAITTVPTADGVVIVQDYASAGERVTVQLIADAGHHVGALMLEYRGQIFNINAVDGVYTFVMPDCDVQVFTSFPAIEEFDITVSPVGNGAVSVIEKAHAGNTIVVYLDPDQGYLVDTLKIEYNGEVVTIELVDGQYSFVMPEADVNVVATFKPVQGGTGVEVLIGVITAILIVAVGIVIALVLRKRAIPKI